MWMFLLGVAVGIPIGFFAVVVIVSWITSREEAAADEASLSQV